MFDLTLESNDLDCEEEFNQRAEDPDGSSHKSPVALRAVSHSLSRRWQALRSDGHEPPATDRPHLSVRPQAAEADFAPEPVDEHYLSVLSKLAGRSDSSGQVLDLNLLAEIGRLISRNLRTHLRATRRAQRQLTRELVALAESMQRPDLARAASGRDGVGSPKAGASLQTLAAGSVES